MTASNIYNLRTNFLPMQPYIYFVIWHRTLASQAGIVDIFYSTVPVGSLIWIIWRSQGLSIGLSDAIYGGIFQIPMELLIPAIRPTAKMIADRMFSSTCPIHEILR
jgi:hypothetical protein